MTNNLTLVASLLAPPPRLLAGEDVDMPVLFYIDPEFYEDEQLSGVTDVTLSYTFFKTEDDDEDE